MLRLLMQAGMGFATFDIGRRIARLKRMAVAYAIAGVLALLGLGALTASAVILLEPRLGAAGAAASVGGGILLIAAIVAWIGGRTPRARRPVTLVERVKAEVGAAGSALSEARAAAPRRAARLRRDFDDTLSEAAPTARPGSKHKRALNMVLLATLAGVVLGRRL